MPTSPLSSLSRCARSLLPVVSWLIVVACEPPQPGQRGRGAPVAAILPPLRPLPAESASAAVSRFSFIVYGDTRGRRDGVATQEEHALVVESMLRSIARLDSGPDPVRFVIQSGDAVVDGRDAAQWNVSFVRLINRLTREAGVPYFLAPGNHDVTEAQALRDAGRRTGLANYLQAVGALIPPDGSLRRLAGYPTYAFGFGNTFVLAFDSNIADDATQFTWVKRQLEGLDRTRYRHVVVMFHHPVLSSGPHGGATIEWPTDAVRRRYLPLFRAQGVTLLVTGHEHFFEHWVERFPDASGQPRRMDQVVSGGGGAPLYRYEGDPDLTAYRKASQGGQVALTQLSRPGPRAADNPYHYGIVHVDGARMWLEVIGVDWGEGYRPYAGGRVVDLTDPPAPR
jgi:hypothetical protein